MEQFAILFVGIVVLIILYGLIGSILEHNHFHFIHETGVGILIGIVFGLILYTTNNIQKVGFSQDIFFYGLLPQMIFCGGYNLKKKKFMQNIKYIMLFGLFGTIIAFGVILGLSYLINHFEIIQTKATEQVEAHTVTFSFGLLVKFAATISASDSVAALTLIKAKEYPKLFSIIFGQGMVNDAVAIILFKVVGDLFDEAESAVNIISKAVKRNSHQRLSVISPADLIGSSSTGGHQGMSDYASQEFSNNAKLSYLGTEQYSLSQSTAVEAELLNREVIEDLSNENHQQQRSVPLTLLYVLGMFVLNVVAALVIGVFVALLCSKIFQKCRFLGNNPVMQVAMLYLFGILSYLIAELLDISGVITVLVCGISLAHFNFYNLSMTGQICTGVAFQTISFIAESIVFIYMGISTIYYMTQETLSLPFLGIQLCICVIARTFSIFGVSLLVKLFDKKWAVSMYELAIVSAAGTIRGSVAFALILTIKVQGTDAEAVSIIKNTVLLMVFITTISLGGAMPKFIGFCLSRDESIGNSRFSVVPFDMPNKPVKPLKGFKLFDEKYLKPWFIYKYVQRKDEIKEFKRALKLNSPEYKGGQFVGLLKANARQSIIGQIISPPRQSVQPSANPQQRSLLSEELIFSR